MNRWVSWECHHESFCERPSPPEEHGTTGILSETVGSPLFIINFRLVFRLPPGKHWTRIPRG